LIFKINSENRNESRLIERYSLNRQYDASFPTGKFAGRFPAGSSLISRPCSSIGN